MSLLEPEIFQLDGRWNETNVASFLHQSSYPPVVIVLLLQSANDKVNLPDLRKSVLTVLSIYIKAVTAFIQLKPAVVVRWLIVLSLNGFPGGARCYFTPVLNLLKFITFVTRLRSIAPRGVGKWMSDY